MKKFKDWMITESLEMMGPNEDAVLDALNLLHKKMPGDLVAQDGSGHNVHPSMFSIELELKGEGAAGEWLRGANDLLRGSGCRIYAI